MKIIEYFRKRRDRRQREMVAFKAISYTIAEAPLVYRWINGDDVAAELKESWEQRYWHGNAPMEPPQIL